MDVLSSGALAGAKHRCIGRTVATASARRQSVRHCLRAWPRRALSARRGLYQSWPQETVNCGPYIYAPLLILHSPTLSLNDKNFYFLLQFVRALRCSWLSSPGKIDLLEKICLVVSCERCRHCFKTPGQSTLLQNTRTANTRQVQGSQHKATLSSGDGCAPYGLCRYGGLGCS